MIIGIPKSLYNGFSQNNYLNISGAVVPWLYGSWIITTYAITAYHHWCCEFESWSVWGVQHYVIKVCQWLATGQWFSLGPPVSSINKTDNHNNWNIDESGIKHHQTNKQT